MNTNPLRQVSWLLAVGLGAVALVRPVVRIVETQLGVSAGPVLPVALTVVITAVWVTVVGLSRVPRPLLTLVAAGLVYAVLSIVLSGILSPLLTGELQGPLAMPFAIIPVLVVNAVWGLVAGALALALRHLRGASRPEPAVR